MARSVEVMNRKIDLSFLANFRAALGQARSAFGMTDADNRRSSAHQAINRFMEAQQVYLGLLDEEFSKDGVFVYQYLSMLILSHVSAARCYLELGETETALKHLEEGSATLQPRLTKYFDSVVGVNPSIFLHPNLSESITLERMANLYRYQSPKLSGPDLFESRRKQLWETAVQTTDPWLAKMPDFFWKADVDGFRKIGPMKKAIAKEEMWAKLCPRLPEAFAHVESCFEAVNCLTGYQIELEHLVETGTSFKEWQNMALPVSEPGDPLIWIVPQTPELFVASAAQAPTPVASAGPRT